MVYLKLTIIIEDFHFKSLRPAGAPIKKGGDTTPPFVQFERLLLNWFYNYSYYIRRATTIDAGTDSAGTVKVTLPCRLHRISARKHICEFEVPVVAFDVAAYFVTPPNCKSSNAYENRSSILFRNRPADGIPRYRWWRWRSSGRDGCRLSGNVSCCVKSRYSIGVRCRCSQACIGIAGCCGSGNKSSTSVDLISWYPCVVSRGWPRKIDLRWWNSSCRQTGWDWWYSGISRSRIGVGRCCYWLTGNVPRRVNSSHPIGIGSRCSQACISKAGCSGSSNESSTSVDLYPDTPMLSVEAFHARLICDDETVVAVRPVGTDGAVVSVEAALVVAETATDCPETFPVVSKADTL